MTSSTQRFWMLAAMFTVGFLAGAAVAAGLVWHFHPRPGMPSGAEIVQHLRRDLRSELHLSPAQDAALTPVLDQHARDLDVIRHETVESVFRAIEAKNLAVRQILTPAQREAFDRKEAERMREFKSREHAGW